MREQISSGFGCGDNLALLGIRKFQDNGFLALNPFYLHNMPVSINLYLLESDNFCSKFNYKITDF